MASGRRAAEAADRRDPLAGLRDCFRLPPGIVYLEGNSLGPPVAWAAQRVAEAVEQWGGDLVGSWWRHGWAELPRRLATRLAPLVGTDPAGLAVGDSTSVDLFKLLAAACELRPERPRLLVEEGIFPTDAYVAEAVARRSGKRVVTRPAASLGGAVDESTAVVLVSHVDYRSGGMVDLPSLADACHGCGALLLVDVSHSVGAMPLALDSWGVDLAVGCGYKYLSGGPGAPAFAYVSPALRDALPVVVAGWWGHRDPFAFAPEFNPAGGATRLQAGTPPVLSMVALDAALDVFDDVDMDEVRRKSEALVATFLEHLTGVAPHLGPALLTPSSPVERGSHVALRHPDAQALVGRLETRGVVVDHRPPDLVRCGFGPLFLRYVDAWHAAAAVADAWD